MLKQFCIISQMIILTRCSTYEYDITMAPTKNSHPTLHTLKETKAFNIVWKSFHANFWC